MTTILISIGFISLVFIIDLASLYFIPIPWCMLASVMIALGLLGGSIYLSYYTKNINHEKYHIIFRRLFKLTFLPHAVMTYMLIANNIHNI